MTRPPACLQFCHGGVRFVCEDGTFVPVGWVHPAENRCLEAAAFAGVVTRRRIAPGMNVSTLLCGRRVAYIDLRRCFT